MNQPSIDQANAEFWDELCGTNKAKQLGVTDNSPESITKFDNWYMDYYRYLNEWIPFEDLVGKMVLEVGLGYGTVLQRMLEAGVDYRGLDIALGPVAMGNYRIGLVGGNGECVHGSVLEAPFKDGLFDYVISIGCLHHTGNFRKALSELYRVLRPGGSAIIMVYYAYSFRRWSEMTNATINQFLSEKLRIGKRRNVTKRERQRYDYDSEGQVAPETEFLSRAEVKRVARSLGFKSVKQGLELMGEGLLTRIIGRKSTLKIFSPIGGRHIYARLTK
ncbi:MAG: hypothetical protein BMS9Abin05_2653 [Rhodothermia bacterium]|nr:MAG: hypothetical protein BMS9Abin05_2653 [Rhodothermia bacterium]